MSGGMVSILINNRNYARFLGEAIESALSQTYADKEVVVVDDGSTDDSRDVIARHAGAIIPLLKENGGQTSALNAGVKRCRGEIVLILDADDFLLPGTVHEAVRHFDDPRIVKVHWPLWVVDEHSKRTNGFKPVEAPPSGDLMEQVIEHGPEHAGWPPTSGNAYRRSYLEQVFPLPEIERELGIGSANADKYLTMLTPFFGHVSAIERPMACYRVHGSNDLATLEFERRLSRDLAIFERYSEILVGYFAQRGIAVDPLRWKCNSWTHHLREMVEQIEHHIPAGRSFIFVDDAACGMGSIGTRRAVPFLERNGRYWGAPENDEAALCELDRLRQGDTQFLVFAWPAFWWLEHYRQFARAVQSSFRCVARNDVVMIFDLSDGGENGK